MQSIQHPLSKSGRVRRWGRFGAVAAIITGLLVVPAAAQAGFTDDYEGYRVSTTFDASSGATASVVSASGDYVAYVANYNSVVIKHFTGPGDNDWETTTLAAPPAMQGSMAKRVVVDAVNGRAIVTPYPKTYTKAGGFPETTAEVFVYRLSGTNTWTYEKTLTVAEPVGQANRANFGYSLEVSGDVIAVSAESARRESGVGNGAVYLINVVTGDWTRVEHSDSLGTDEFGTFIGFSGNKLAVSSPNPVSTCDRFGTGAATSCRLGKVTLFDVSGVQATNPRVIRNPMDPKTFHVSGVSMVPFGTALKFSNGKLFVSSPEEMNFTSDDPFDPVGGLVSSAFSSGTSTQGAIYVFDDVTGLQLGGKIIPPPNHYNAAENFAVSGDQLVMTSLNEGGGQYEKGELLFYDLASLNYVSGDINNRQQPVPVVEYRPEGLADGAQFGIHTGNIVLDNGKVYVPSPQIDTGRLYVLEPVRKRSATLGDVTVVYGQGGTVSASVDSSGKDGGTAALTIDAALHETVTVAGYAANFTLPSAGNSFLVGTHPMSVSYTGPSGSSAVVANANLIVTKANTATALSPLELTGDTQIGVSTTIRGQVTAQFGTIPTGKVKITVNGGNEVEATLDASGRFVAQINGQTSTNLAYEVNYVGDANHLPSTVSDSATAPEPPVSAAWSVTKAATVNALTPAGGVVKPGDVINYEVTATAGTRDIDDVVISDDLSGVLSSAAFVPGSATLTVGTGSAVSVANPNASGLLKTAATVLPAGEKMTLKYRVTVDDDAWFETLTNTVTAAGSTAPANCVAGASPMPAECSTTHVTGALFEVKKVSRDVGGTVTPLTGASFEVLQDASGAPGAALTTLTEEAGNAGVFKLRGLRPGTYWLSELSSPAGFTLLPEPAKFVLSDTGVLTLADPSKHSQMSVDKWTVTVVNSAPVALPLTGGLGSMPYIGAGVLLTLVASGLALNARHRSRKTA